MKTFESNVTDSITSLQACIVKSDAKITAWRSDIGDMMDRIDNIEICKSQVPAVEKELQAAIDNLKNEIRRHELYIRGEVATTDRNKSALRVLQHYACPHTKHTETGFDYYKRETYYKCDLCGYTW